MRFHNKIPFPFFFFIGLCILLSDVYAGDGDTGKGKTNKDTVTALVIAPSNPLYKNISNLSGNQIITLIDSLIDLKDAPLELLKEINDYAESRLLEHDFYISLTNYYENSEIPSNSVYGKWDTRNILAYDESISKHDTLVPLTLVDTKNNCNYVAPLTSPVVTSGFGWREGKNHNGVDLDLEVWDPVVAAFDGMVRISLFHPGYGRVVVIRHYNGLETLYAHLHRLKVKAGDVVEAGQIIGLGGSSGHSTGSHLHFEVRFKGKPLNPKKFISFKKNKLVSDSLQLVKNKWSYSVVPSGIKYHKVERGDFMYKIAALYGVSVNQLCELNGLSKESILVLGKKLRIK